MNNWTSKDKREAHELALARSSVYGFLANIYRDAPTEVFLRHIVDPSFLYALSNLGITLSSDSIGLSDVHAIQDLAVEFTGLFIGPGEHISPHESVHRNNEDGGLWGQSTVDVKYFIQRSGCQYRPEFRGLPDHISVELEFMSGICRQEADGWRQQDAGLVHSTRKTQKEFLTEHLVIWVPQFCSKVVEAAKLPYYREMAKLTSHYIKYELEEISQWPEPSDDIEIQSGISPTDPINTSVSV